ncbi:MULTISPECIES: hypothetical protein [unclassified Amycolatopsis]|uniref:hypothetical protein n=1 Tax=unclassified Amycolatopsis TaxID=2618356 RepID=UPI00287481DD|nr:MULTISPECIES: hypothetical protein [unclassified Amycolatopsis]MDS0140620.1 hypothetical protein [Amycolatopsis sp. 505]MDS0149270.1 hypothetical protein [Amycolatopsis sp. CM201R]
MSPTTNARRYVVDYDCGHNATGEIDAEAVARLSDMIPVGMVAPCFHCGEDTTVKGVRLRRRKRPAGTSGRKPAGTRKK